MSSSPGFFYTILWFLVAIGPLIIFHELGHYLVARWCGVKSEVFSIGFGREIFGWTDRRGTRWKLGWLPMGGYVRFAGDMDAASRPDPHAAEKLSEEQAGMFQFKSVWQRAAIVAAGPFANFVVAMAIFMALFATYGQNQTKPVVALISAGSAAEAAGFKIGDKVVSVDGRAVHDFADIADHVRLRANHLVTFGINREGRTLTLTAAPKSQEFVSRFGTKTEFGVLGIGSNDIETVQLPVSELPGAAFHATVGAVRSMIDGLSRIIMGYISVKELGGPVMMAKVSGEIATMGWEPFIAFVAMLSINLGFVNLLPVPMLDGGHLMFNTIEAVRRRPVSLRAQEWAYRAGFFIVIGFMFMVTFNDLMRFGWLQQFGDLIG